MRISPLVHPLLMLLFAAQAGAQSSASATLVKAARLIDPRAAGRLSALEEALSAFGYAVAIEVHEKPAA